LWFFVHSTSVESLNFSVTLAQGAEAQAVAAQPLEQQQQQPAAQEP
jgi:hypothetical protein